MLSLYRICILSPMPPVPLPPFSAALPPLIGRLTLIAEQITPALTRLPKTARATVGSGIWMALYGTIAATFAALSDPQNPAPRRNASAHFDLLKWGLRLLVSQRLASPGWLAALGPDLAEAGRMIGGMVRSATRRTPAF